MGVFTVLSLSSDGVRRSTTLEAENEKAAKKVAAEMNAAIADQEQTEEYTVKEVTEE